MYRETQTPLPWQSLTRSNDFGGGLELPDRSVLIGDFLVSHIAVFNLYIDNIIIVSNKSVVFVILPLMA